MTFLDFGVFQLMHAVSFYLILVKNYYTPKSENVIFQTRKPLEIDKYKLGYMKNIWKQWEYLKLHIIK